MQPSAGTVLPAFGAKLLIGTGRYIFAGRWEPILTISSVLKIIFYEIFLPEPFAKYVKPINLGGEPTNSHYPQIAVMRFSLVAVLLAAAATAIPMPKDNLDIGALLDGRRNEISDLMHGVADFLKNVKRDETSDLESEADAAFREMETALEPLNL
ncbi:uncharacterized protein N7498_001083 [Penicillium cinerascens]|uniref:Uncharacterized protein n=1 Tax=Penicillium cinerascens TaxID=70096 RepID=A0A9W9NFH5_9EURO|nr:uncharacterized protein N7498_001083 [Penicillium cinerascens]KAJ5218984.1 hypothetical protein N7498_001083 [Penicillium cinerascens]